MSAIALPASSPAKIRHPRTRVARSKPASVDRVLVALATSDELTSGMADALAALGEETGAKGVEWWSDGDGAQALAAHGRGAGTREAFSLGEAGWLVFFGGSALRARAATARIAPLVRRRLAEERLLEETARLARRNDALEDFAALVAHELKTLLKAAEADAPGRLEQALNLVDSLLQMARTDVTQGVADPESSLATALEELGSSVAEIEADLPAELPVAPTALRVLFRNLIGNAVAAGARNIHVAGSRSESSWSLVVDDDGIGLTSSDGYAAGSGLGLQLSRRLAERLGGALELCPRLGGGTRAMVAVGTGTR